MFAPPVCETKPPQKRPLSAAQRSAVVARRTDATEPLRTADTGMRRTAGADPRVWDYAKLPIFVPGNLNASAPCSALPLGSGRVQRKLELGAIDDPREKEADRVADQIMRLPEPAAAPASLHEPTGSRSAVGEAPAIVSEVLSLPGEPLDAATRAYFEPRFRHDFSRVRIHTDDMAARSAEAIAARAYTAGHDIVFGKGTFSPETSTGRHLLAHELAHVMQQSAPDPAAAVASGLDRQRATIGAPFHGSIARQPKPSPPADIGWSDAGEKGLKGLNQGPVTVDAAGKISTGKIDSATTPGVWRIPLQNLRKDKKGRAVVLIPNTVAPTALDKDKNVSIEVLLHFHGFGAGYRELKKGESDYAGVLQPGELRDVDLYQMEQQLLAHVKASKRLIIAVLPQGSEYSNFGDISADSGAYLKEVFAKLVPGFLPQGATPGRLTVSGHSGGGPTALAVAKQRKTERTDVLLFDAINFGCAERVPVVDDKGEPVLDENKKPKTECKDKTVCASNEFFNVRDWIRSHIDADVKSLPSTPADQKGELKTKGTRFRGFTSDSLETKETCSYGYWYNQLKNDVEATIKKLSLSDDVKNQLRENYQVKSVPGPHERVLAHGSLEAALAD